MPPESSPPASGLATQASLVSVIVRSMDRPTLQQALQSIAAQTWPAIEVVLVDARGSGHRAMGNRCGPFELRLIEAGRPLGRPHAANEGLRAARGRWACFLDDDDWLDPGHIELLARRLQQASAAVAAYSGVSCVLADPDSGELRELVRYNLAFDPARLVCENYLPIHSVLFSLEAARQTRGFDESLPIFEDWDFWIQLSRAGAFSHVDQVSATYRLGSGDSGLYGNVELQERFARRILDKWLPAMSAQDWAGVWALCRSGLRTQDSLQRQIEAGSRDLEDVRAGYTREIARLGSVLTAQVAEAQRQAREAARIQAELVKTNAHLAEILQQRAQEAAEVQARLTEALHGTMQEYESAVALLRKEQYTVVRPIARNLKRGLLKVWRRTPAPLQGVVRQALGRPAPVRPPAGALEPAAPASPAELQLDWRALLAGGRPGAFTVVVFPVIDWHFRIQRPQHLARELARQGHRVLYLTTTFAAADGGLRCRHLESPAENVHLVQLALSGDAPNLYQDLLTRAQAQELADTLVWLQQTADLGAFVSLVHLPFWRPVASCLPANLMVYDCMDYHAGFSTNTGVMLNEEMALLRDCDLLVTSSAELARRMQEKAPGKPHALIRNGCEVEHFAKAPATLKIQRDGWPVVGYFGAISEWFDMPLVLAMARERPQWRFVLVGSTFGCETREAKRLPNIELVGEVPYADLPAWVHGFDVCIIPFVINELTTCTNPVKVYEYLSAGKPVVATRLPEVEAIGDQVHLASTAGEFLQGIEAALQDAHDAVAAAARMDWARDHSWRARADALSTAVARCLPRVSVIVLCYNNLALTRECLHSIEQQTLWPDLELVVVDNASSDGTPDWLREFAATRPWVKLVLNEGNLGFAAGNNVGLAAATGDILIMLNNDTQVSPGWVHGLWRHLDHHPGLGMVGPVTDNIGNEAKIGVEFSTMAEMPAWAAARAVRHRGEQSPCRVLAFFCVALRREVYEQVGGLDESFGLGFFEDDDYCNRARSAGWGLAIAEDVFVHHHLSASFDQVKASSRQALFEKNKAIYERKWGPWIPHRYREAKTSE
jgi:GT2 family glycosyltransferase/glycosyltransferase involved in cell wall biosynthesis/Skp family chaperone for outer membrane proteins